MSGDSVSEPSPTIHAVARSQSETANSGICHYHGTEELLEEGVLKGKSNDHRCPHDEECVSSTLNSRD